MNKTSPAVAPTISMREFFALPEVLALQSVQKTNTFGSPAHRKASADMLVLADRYDVAEYFE